MGPGFLKSGPSSRDTIDMLLVVLVHLKRPPKRDMYYTGTLEDLVPMDDTERIKYLERLNIGV